MDTITRTCKSLIKFLLRIDGQDLIEYALLAAIVSLGSVATMKTLATDVQTIFTNSGTTFSADTKGSSSSSSSSSSGGSSSSGCFIICF